MKNKTATGTEATFLKALDSVFHKKPEYLVFWDKDGILQKGLWVLFGHNPETLDTGGRVLKILPDPEFGDIMLCIASPISYEEMVDREPDLRDIVGFATVVFQEPEYIPKYLQEYWSRIYARCKQSGFSGYKRAVYEYIMARLQDSKLLFAKGVTMPHPGQIEVATSGAGSPMCSARSK